MNLKVSTDFLTVKVTTQHPAWPLLRQTPGASGVWGRYRFVINETVERCDYWVVCDGLVEDESCVCAPENTLFLTWEPPSGVRPPYSRRFLTQFSAVLTCHPGLRHRGVRYGQQGHPWFVGKDYDTLTTMDLPGKSLPLVVISSDKEFAPGHRDRLFFARAVKEYFGEDARLVGRGIEDFDDKWDVLAPARYSVAIENAVCDDWLTEKLPDCLLAGAFPIYHGAPNVGNYLPDDAFLQIDVRNVQTSLRAIEDLLSRDDHFERIQPVLEQARYHYLQNLQLFPTLAAWLDKLGLPNRTPTIPVTLRTESAIEGLRVKLQRKFWHP